MRGTTASAANAGWDMLDALAAADGTAGHPHARALLAPRAPRRDLADAVHALLALHGTRPGLADEAADHAGPGPEAAWLRDLADAFAGEREALARLAAAAGPPVSTPGQAAADAAFAAQRHAFRMLARSDRVGVAAGAAAALALDWLGVRRVLARAADAYDAELPPPMFPLPEAAPATRAALFGVRALLDQHRALWSLLEARASAREG